MEPGARTRGRCARDVQGGSHDKRVDMQRQGTLSPAPPRPRLRPYRALFRLYTAIVLLAAGMVARVAQADINVDGVIDESEWEGAVQCADWRSTQPFSLDEPRYRNELRVRALPEGLAAAF